MAGTSIAVKSDICVLLGFEEGKLLFSYLGVPMVSKCLSKAECIPLIEMIQNRINNWT